MDQLLLITSIALLIVTIVGAWGLTLIGLPGNWLMVLALACYVWLAPAIGVTHITWGTTAALAVLAGVGELAELAAGIWGARRAGGSRRAAVFSLIGSLMGAVFGAGAGIPIPIFGSAIAAVFGGALGALAGATIAEQTRGETSQQSLRVGKAAFVGRLVGTGIKTLVGTIMAVVAIVALII